MKHARLLAVALMVAMLLSLGAISIFADVTTHTVTTEAELKDAIAAAQDGDIVSLQNNITLTGTLTVDKSITIEGNGFALIGEGTDAWSTDASAKYLVLVTAKNANLQNVTLQAGETNAPAFGLQYYAASGTLHNVAVDGFTSSPATINASAVTVTGSMAVTNSGWGGGNTINVAVGTAVAGQNSSFDFSEANLEAGLVYADDGDVERAGTITITPNAAWEQVAEYTYSVAAVDVTAPADSTNTYAPAFDGVIGAFEAQESVELRVVITEGEGSVTYSVTATVGGEAATDFAEGKSATMTLSIPATVVAEDGLAKITHVHGNNTHTYIEKVVNGQVSIENAAGFSDFVITPAEATSYTLQAGDSLTYNGKTVTNKFSNEITLTYFAKYDSYAMAEVAFTTVSGTADYTGEALAPENFTFADGEYYDTFSPVIISGTGSVGYFRLDQSGISITNVGSVANGALANITYDGQSIADYFVVNTEMTSFGTLTVNPIDLDEAAVAPDADITYIYNAQDQTITLVATESTVKGGNAITYTYSLTKDGEYTAVAPTFKNADTYTVYWKATAANHNAAEGSYTVTVEKAKVTLTATADSIIYGTPTYTPAGVIIGVMEGDDLGVEWTTTYTSATTVADGATISATYTKNSNYEVTVEDAELTVTPADITVDSVAQDGTLTYNKTEQAPAYTAAVTTKNDMAWTIKFSWTEADYAEMPKAMNADTYTVYYSITAENHNDATGSFTFTIGKAKVTLTATAGSIIYGTPTYTPNGVITGVMEGDDLGVEWTTTYTSATTVADGATIGATYTENSNYKVDVEDAKLTVRPAEITDVSVSQTGTLTYNGTAQDVSYNATATTVNDMEWKITFSTEKDGTYGEMPKVTFSGEIVVYYWITAKNHEPVDGELTVTVGKITGIVIKTESFTKVYDGTPLSGSNVITFATGLNKFVAGDNVVLVEAATITDVGAVANAPKFEVRNAANEDVTKCYDISFSTNATLTVTPAPITVTANPWTITYGEAPANNSYTVTGLPETGAAITGEPTWTYTYVQYGKVGTYEISLKGLDTGNKNYTIDYKPGVLTVNPKAITVTANNKEITYGDAVVDNGYTADVENGDVLDVKYVFEEAEKYVVGTYTITVTDADELSEDSKNHNYTITYESGNLTIEKKTITITSKTEILYYTGDAYLRDNIFGMDDLTIAGLVGEDTLELGNFTFAAADPTEFVGSISTPESTTLTLTFTHDNYVIEDNTLTWEVIVQGADIKVVFNPVTYNGLTYSFADLTYTVYVDGKPVEVAVEHCDGTESNADAGTYNVTVRVITDGAYKNCQATATWTINPYVISDADDITWNIGNYTYNGKVQGPAASLTIHNKTVFFNVSTEIYVGEHEAYILGISDINGAQTGVANYKLDKFSIPTAFFEIKEAADVKFQSASVVIGEDYAVKFYVVAEAIDQYGPNANFSVVIAGPNGDVTVTRDDLVKVGNRYAFSYDAIGPHQMGELLTATLTVADKTDDRDYSIEQYCYNQLVKNAADTEFTTVIVAMLKYGAEAQKFMNANVADADLVTDALYNDGAYAAFVNVDTKKAEYVNSQAAYRDNINVTGHSITAALNNTAAIRYSATMANIDTMDYTVEVVKNGKVVKTFTEADFAYNTSNGRYYIDFVVGLTGAGDAYTFVVKADGALAAEVTYSIETYANKNSSNAFVTTFADFSALLAAYLY